MIILVVILIFVALGLLAAFTVSATTGSAESIANSIASIEQARAMQAQAEATQGAVHALSAATFMDKLQGVLILVLLIAVVGLIAYVYRKNMKLRQMQMAALLVEENKPKTVWAPGPDAGWKKLGDTPTTAALPQPTFQEMMGMAMMTMMMRLMGQSTQEAPHHPPALPANTRRMVQAQPNEDSDDWLIDYSEIENTQPSNAWEEMFK